MTTYRVSFDFPYGKTWLKSFFVDDRISCTIEIPEFTNDFAEAKDFDTKTEAENAGKFYCGKYNWNVIEYTTVKS